MNFQESTTVLNARTKKVWKLIVCTSYIYIYIYIYGEMVDFVKSDKMIKTSGKVDKPTLTSVCVCVCFG